MRDVSVRLLTCAWVIVRLATAQGTALSSVLVSSIRSWASYPSTTSSARPPPPLLRQLRGLKSAWEWEMRLSLGMGDEAEPRSDATIPPLWAVDLLVRALGEGQLRVKYQFLLKC